MASHSCIKLLSLIYRKGVLGIRIGSISLSLLYLCSCLGSKQDMLGTVVELEDPLHMVGITTIYDSSQAGRCTCCN